MLAGNATVPELKISWHTLMCSNEGLSVLLELGEFEIGFPMWVSCPMEAARPSFLSAVVMVRHHGSKEDHAFTSNYTCES